MRPEEFRLGTVSLPAPDADDLPEVCLACPYLAHKEFSTGADGLYYYFCAYHHGQDRSSPARPPCLEAR